MEEKIGDVTVLKVTKTRANTNEPPPNSVRHSVTDQLWHTVEIVMVGPLPKTERGKEYIATCTCLFGKWPEAEALKNKLQLLRQSLFSV